MKKNLLLSTAFSVVLLTGAAHAATNQQAAYGEAVASSNVARQITITADTKSVNVNDGDTVAFNVNGKTFTWHFDTLRGMGIDYAQGYAVGRPQPFSDTTEALPTDRVH